MTWRACDGDKIHKHWYTTAPSREAAFALAGVRNTNSGVRQHVWNVETGEQWTVSFTDFSSHVSRRKDGVSAT